MINVRTRVVCFVQQKHIRRRCPGCSLCVLKEFLLQHNLLVKMLGGVATASSELIIELVGRCDNPDDIDTLQKTLYPLL